jgi:O-antigen/teichoic acid export membrane protein
LTVRTPPNTSAAWVAMGTGFSGAATYLLLIITARAVGPEAYGEFSLFWAVIVIVSLGLFLPIEQAVARRMSQIAARGASGRPLLRQGLRVASVVGAVSAVLVIVFWAILRDLSPTGLLFVTALAVGIVGFVMQFPARGILAAMSRFRDYGAVVSVDAGVRFAIAFALWFASARSAVPFALGVGCSAVVCGLVGLALASRRLSASARGSEPDVPDEHVVGLGRELRHLISAAVCMQLLLNSGVLIAMSVSSTRDSAFAGHLLAVLTIARVPVFVFQSVQASYLSKIASRSYHRDTAGLRRVLLGLAGAVAAVAGVTLVGAALAGPAAIKLVFGPSYEIGRGATILVGLGISVYLAAAVANDVAVAIGAQTHVRRAWAAGVVAAAVVVVSVHDVLLRSTLPLIVGAAVAGCVLAPPVLRSSRGKANR